MIRVGQDAVEKMWRWMSRRGSILGPTNCEGASGVVLGLVISWTFNLPAALYHLSTQVFVSTRKLLPV
jgi:hypothetical protein